MQITITFDVLSALSGVLIFKKDYKFTTTLSAKKYHSSFAYTIFAQLVTEKDFL